MAATTRTRSLAAVGLVVQDLGRAVEFYTSIIGMAEAQRIDVPDKHLVEVVLTFPGSRGAVILLMQYDDGADHTYTDDGGKVVLQVGDCVAVTEAARAAGHAVTREPGEYPGFGMIAMIQDPDGRTIELMGGGPAEVEPGAARTPSGSIARVARVGAAARAVVSRAASRRRGTAGSRTPASRSRRRSPETR